MMRVNSEAAQRALATASWSSRSAAVRPRPLRPRPEPTSRALPAARRLRLQQVLKWGDFDKDKAYADDVRTGRSIPPPAFVVLRTAEPPPAARSPAVRECRPFAQRGRERLD